MNKYYFDEQAAQKAIGFIQTFCTHTKGELAGKPLLLEDWQKKIIGDLFGWKQENGLRKYRTCFIEVPRKNGKSTLCAAIGLYMLFADSERGSEVYSAAGDRAQAGIVFEIAKRMIITNPELTSRSKVFRNSITNESKGNFYQAISSDSKTKHGFNANCIIFDELHTQPNRDLWDTLLTSTGSRRQPLCIAITTAGYDRQSICYEIYDYAKKVQSGAIEDESFLSVIYEADEEYDDITSEETWKKANPNYEISLRKEYMQRESQRAVDVPSYQNTFKRLMLNIWTDSQTAWIGNKEWELCKGEIDLQKLKGKECWAGLDLASTRDISALVLIFKEDDVFQIVPFFFIPEMNAKKRSERDKVDYMTWIKQNHVIATSGDVADYNFIKQKIKDLSLEYRINSIAYDRWNASQLVIDLQNDGANMAPFGQGFQSMSAPTKELEKLILGKQIIHDGNPAMNWMLSNVALQESPAGDIKPNKAKSTEKIDGVVALIMSLGEYMTTGDLNSVYDGRGLLVL